MKNDFIRYDNVEEINHYFVSTICFWMLDYAKEYVKHKNKMIKDIDSRLRDVVLVNLINYIGGQGDLDFGLTIDSIYSKNNDNIKLNSEIVINYLIDMFSKYIFTEDIVMDAVENLDTGLEIMEFGAGEIVMVIIDYLNFIAKKNNYRGTFTAGYLEYCYSKKRGNKGQNELKR